MTGSPEVRWQFSPKGKKWHAFIYFRGYETLGSVCSGYIKPRPEDQVAALPTAGTEGSCRDCRFGVMGTKKRYAPEEAGDDG